MRYAFIKELIVQAKKNKNIMLLTGDLGFTVFEEFQKNFPDRFLNVGVAEQNLISIATGLAMTGKIVFAYSIASFATMRPYEQIRNDVAAHNASVIIVGSGAGLSYGDNAHTHHAVEDISLMRVIPNMTILHPADPYEATWATGVAAQLRKPVYLRLGKKGEPNLAKQQDVLTLGKARLLKTGKDAVILVTGPIAITALSVAKQLEHESISVAVYTVHTLKPIDKQFIHSLSRMYSCIITLEEHSIIGGLGSIVSEIISEYGGAITVLSLGIPDTFIDIIGDQTYIRDQIGLSSEKLIKKLRKELVTYKK